MSKEPNAETQPNSPNSPEPEQPITPPEAEPTPVPGPPEEPAEPETPGTPTSPEDTTGSETVTNQSELQEVLNNYAKAFREEFEQSTQADPENVEEYTRDFFKRNIHSAAAQIVWLANNATTESVRLRAATTVVHEALAASAAAGDPIKELINELTRS